jgi:putative ABC transport system permease protein
VSEGYLKAMAMTLLAGRDLDARDTAVSPRVAVVNQAFARGLGLGADVVGRRFRREATPSQPEQVFEIVGLVANTKYWSLREEFVPIAFVARAQNPGPDFYVQLMVKASGPARDVAARLRASVADLHPAIQLDVRPFEAIVRGNVQTERLLATLSAFFAVLAALIAALGLYGVLSYAVARRTRELGIRMALGADGRKVEGLVLGDAGRLLAAGLAIGTLAALGAARATASMLYGVTTYDPEAYAAAAALLAAVAGVASYLPSRRAARLDPVTALREE